jgi:hypothetical protein
LWKRRHDVKAFNRIAGNEAKGDTDLLVNLIGMKGRHSLCIWQLEEDGVEIRCQSWESTIVELPGGVLCSVGCIVEWSG